VRDYHLHRCILLNTSLTAETLNHRFINQLIAVLRPLKDIAEQQKAILATDPSSPEWSKFIGLKSQLRETSAAVL